MACNGCYRRRNDALIDMKELYSCHMQLSCQLKRMSMFHEDGSLRMSEVK